MAAVWVSVLGSTVCLSAGLAGYSFSEYHKLTTGTGALLPAIHYYASARPSQLWSACPTPCPP